MVGPVRFDGLSSGIDYTSIIEKLLSLQRRPIQGLQARAKSVGERKAALLQVSASLLALKGVADNFARPSFWAGTKVSSSNESVLKAGGGQAGALGAYTFTVKRLAQSHQLVSNGFASDTASITAADSKIRIELGGGFLERRTPVSFLNGQTGIDRGSIKITDSSGDLAVINLEHAVTVKDVLDAINNNTQIDVTASVTGDRIDVKGATLIENYGADTTATSLGLDQAAQLVGGTWHVYGRDVSYATGSTPLDLLNDRLGVRTVSGNDFTITDKLGAPYNIDLQSSDDTIQKVIDRINAVTPATLNASLSSDGTAIVLDDTSGGLGSLAVATAGGSFAAVDLGFGVIDPATGTFTQVATENSADGLPNPTGDRLYGNRLIPALDSTLRTLLRGGQTNTVAGELKGVRDGTVRFDDRTVTPFVDLDLSSRVSTTNASVGAGLTAITVGSLNGFAVGNRFRIRTSSGVEERTVTAINTVTNEVSFDQALGGALAGGEGVFAMNESLEDILRNVNDRLDANGIKIRASIDPETNGIQLTEFSGGAGAWSVTDVAGSAGSDLGITAPPAGNTINGADLDVQWLSERTLLSSMNQGTGVKAGELRVTDTNGNQFEVDLTQSDDVNLAEVIKDGNGAAVGAASGVRFRINDSGDGLLVEDTTPGAGTLKIEELGGGRTARDLNILGSAPSTNPDTIDGSFEISIDVKAGSTLKDAAAAINARGIAVQASVINDGSPINSYKLTVLSKRSGEAARLVVESEIFGLSFSATAAAQDSLLLYGSNGGATDPVVVSSSSNTVTNLISGLTLQLTGTSDSPVTVTIARDLEAIGQQASKLADEYNSVIAKIREMTFFDPKSLGKGTLFADATVRRIEGDLADLVTRPVSGIPSGDLNNLAAVGFKMTKEGGINFDSSAFTTALQDDFEEVETLFTLQRKLKVDTAIADLNSGLGVDDDPDGADFEITTRSATKKISVDMSGVETISSLLSMINNAPGNNGDIVASISADGFSLRIDDASSVPTRDVEDIGPPNTVTTFDEVDPDISGLSVDFLKGATVTFLTGANAGEVRKVDANSGSLITLDSDLPFVPAAGDTYKIERPLEVKRVGDATAASQLKIEKTVELGKNFLEGGLINLKGDPGAASRMVEALDVLTRNPDGLISTRTDSLDDTITDIDKSIARIETRVEKMQERLIREFARLEVILAQSKETMSRLQSTLSTFVGMQAAAAGNQ
ncbi:MAG: flagellar filament capping protein FliD [Planctomycetes bacterium]|nr:flagellar filament capping protein FliD [Planctomycetota bacterium]